VQGQITVAASDMFESRLATLREERARLSQELALYTAEVAAAPHGSDEAHLSISALLEDIEVRCWVPGGLTGLFLRSRRTTSPLACCW
jgi:hypothetical protein